MPFPRREWVDANFTNARELVTMRGCLFLSTSIRARPWLNALGCGASRAANSASREVVETACRPGSCRAYEECFSFNRFATSSNVPLNGPGVSIFMETSAAANFRDFATS